MQPIQSQKSKKPAPTGLKKTQIAAVGAVYLTGFPDY